MEYCASTASMLAEEIWQIVEGFVEVLRKYVLSKLNTKFQTQLEKWKNFVEEMLIISIMRDLLCDIFHNVQIKRLCILYLVHLACTEMTTSTNKVV